MISFIVIKICSYLYHSGRISENDAIICGVLFGIMAIGVDIAILFLLNKIRKQIIRAIKEINEYKKQRQNEPLIQQPDGYYKKD